MFLFNSEVRNRLSADEIAAAAGKQVAETPSPTFGEYDAINDLTLLPQASLRFDAQTHTHTHKMRGGYKPPTLFNYAVKFYPNALVMLRSREAA